jgi:hypothetical protein
VRCRPKLGEAIWIVQQDEPRGVTGRSRERGAAMLRVLFCDESPTSQRFVPSVVYRR